MSDALLQNYLENAPDAVYMNDMQGNLLYGNRKSELLIGYDRSELIGKNLLELNIISEESREKTAALLKANLEGKSTGPDEIELIRRDGSIVPVEVSTSIIRHNDQNVILGFIRDITERKQAAQALHDSEERYRLLFEEAIEGIGRTTLDGRPIMANKAMARMLGYDSPQDIFNKVTDLASQVYANPEKRREIINRLKQEGRITGNEVFFKRQDGSTMKVLINLRLVYDGFGAPAFIEGSCIDITDRHLAEEARRVSEERYRKIFDGATEGIFQTTPGGVYLNMNHAFAKMFGYGSPREMIGAVRDIGKQLYVDPEDRKELVRMLREYGKIEGYEVEVYRKDKSTFWISINAHTVRDAFGNVLHLEGTNVDITERKNIEKELRKSHAMYRTIFENSGTSIIIIDENTTIVLCNAEWVKISGYSREEVEGKMSWKAFVHPDDIIMMQKYHADRRNNTRNAPRQYEFRFMDRNGNIRNMINTVAMIPGTKMSVAAQLDITDLIQAETDKQKLQSQLLQSQKMEAIGTLAGGIAHDFNNILTALTGYGTILQSSLGPDNPLTTYVNEMLLSSEKASQLTQSLLTFSRKQPITLKPVRLNDIINNTEKLLKRLLTEDIALKTRLTDDDTAIMGDSTQIDQILFNLATNARDAMPRGGSLIIETKRVDLDNEFQRAHGYKAGSYILVTVSDTGVGMDEKTKQHIFDPFFTTKEVGKGTGLGLSTVYGIVKQHNGYINIYSEPGKGTVLHIYLPAARERPKQTEPVSSEMKSGHETILVAEDNDSVRRLIKTILTRYGYFIIEAVDGRDAVDKFNINNDVDLVIIDSVMPGMNGREVYDRIHAINPYIKTLFMSGYTRDIILDKGIEEKDFHFIAKPLSPNGLLLKVREVLDSGIIS